MSLITFRIETEAEFQRITSELKSLDIPFAVKQYRDSAFPMVGQMRSFGEISVSEEYAADVEKLFTEILHRKPPIIPTTRRKINVGKVLWIIYTVVASLLLLKYWYINGRGVEDKNFVYEWSFDNTYFYLKSKKTGEDKHLYVDANLDYNFEESYSYGPGGTLLTESLDFNEDGNVEEAHYFNTNGELVGKYMDVNEDGMLDDVRLVLQNGDTMRLVDSNNNGFLEVVN